MIGEENEVVDAPLSALLRPTPIRTMRHQGREAESGPLTLGQALAARVRLIVWCKSCGHRVEPDVAELVSWHGSGMTVIDWAHRLRCSTCGERDADFVVSRAAR